MIDLPPDALEPDAPTPDTFFRGTRHRSDSPDADAAPIRAIGERLGLALPDALRPLYRAQNGGGSGFVFSAIAPDAPLAPPDADFFRLWRTGLPGDGLLPLGALTTMGALQETFDHDPDHAWREHLPEADRLVRVAQPGFDAHLCLDYVGGRTGPGVVPFDDARWRPGADPPYEAARPDFATYVAGPRDQPAAGVP